MYKLRKVYRSLKFKEGGVVAGKFSLQLGRSRVVILSFGKDVVPERSC